MELLEEVAYWEFGGLLNTSRQWTCTCISLATALTRQC